MKRSEMSSTELLQSLRPGDQVKVLQRHVSRSGMMRHLSLFLAVDGELRDVTWAAADIMGSKRSEHHGSMTIKVGGCGMDMHFHTVYSLSRALFPNGHKCTGRSTKGRTIHRCPSNDHSNDYGMLARRYAEMVTDDDNTQAGREAYCANRAEWMGSQNTYKKSRNHADGGYALNHRTI